MICGAIVAVALATTSSAETSLVPQFTSSCLSIDGVTHRLAQSHQTWVQAAPLSTNTPPEWINLEQVKKFRELPNDACR